MSGARLNGNELLLNGTVGDLGHPQWFASADVRLALQLAGDKKPLTIRLNSGGGSASEGSAIYAALASHKGRKTVIVEGVAASAGSLIAMAGDEVVMALGAIMMVHDPSAVTIGTAAEHAVTQEALNAIADSMAAIYAAKSGKTISAARADMRQERWFTGPQAVAERYADRADTGRRGAAPTAFNFALYQHPPHQLVAMAALQGWSLPTAQTRGRDVALASMSRELRRVGLTR